MQSDADFVKRSTESGKAYGYPSCCIEKFVSQTPSYLQSNRPTDADKLRFKTACINGKFSGFVPCDNHAKQIFKGEITLEQLIDTKTRSVALPFPLDWSKP
jgi:hypothetical protein